MNKNEYKLYRYAQRTTRRGVLGIMYIHFWRIEFETRVIKTAANELSLIIMHKTFAVWLVLHKL